MASNENNQAGGHHIVPFNLLRNVALALLVLTALTVATAKGVHLGMFAAPVAFLIALVKALLVMAFFMGLKYETRGNQIIFGLGFLGLALLFFICALDIWTRVQLQSTL